ncbi:hypothetical protein [Pseudoclavibacter sp. RFBA6]|uniref:hypothetical protein n=1 Tax=Pseudoclavibacter sp. RFBA6 TaxID=2080573 RepID=UPI000CE7AE9E|nr:hypothetical protein [Pseudoclavibacter sp. RFBA6]PPG38750.1 hypothetical protein C5C17_13765 [Pseudoclavibacter sp. RFBA6]
MPFHSGKSAESSTGLLVTDEKGNLIPVGVDGAYPGTIRWHHIRRNTASVLCAPLTVSDAAEGTAR